MRRTSLVTVLAIQSRRSPGGVASLYSSRLPLEDQDGALNSSTSSCWISRWPVPSAFTTYTAGKAPLPSTDGPKAIRFPSGDQTGLAPPTDCPWLTPVTCRSSPLRWTMKISVRGLSTFGGWTIASPAATCPVGSGFAGCEDSGRDDAPADADAPASWLGDALGVARYAQAVSVAAARPTATMRGVPRPLTRISVLRLTPIGRRLWRAQNPTAAKLSAGSDED